MNINWKKSGFVAAILAIIFLTAFAIEQQSEVTCWVMEIKLDVSAEEALITDGVHPNGDGAKQLAAVVFAGVKGWLDAGATCR